MSTRDETRHLSTSQSRAVSRVSVDLFRQLNSAMTETRAAALMILRMGDPEWHDTHASEVAPSAADCCPEPASQIEDAHSTEARIGCFHSTIVRSSPTSQPYGRGGLALGNTDCQFGETFPPVDGPACQKQTLYSSSWMQIKMMHGLACGR